jgi:hypothetical protein
MKRNYGTIVMMIPEKGPLEHTGPKAGRTHVVGAAEHLRSMLDDIGQCASADLREHAQPLLRQIRTDVDVLRRMLERPDLANEDLENKDVIDAILVGLFLGLDLWQYAIGLSGPRPVTDPPTPFEQFITGLADPSGIVGERLARLRKVSAGAAVGGKTGGRGRPKSSLRGADELEREVRELRAEKKALSRKAACEIVGKRHSMSGRTVDRRLKKSRQ